jgi:hypothetical protein
MIISRCTNVKELGDYLDVIERKLSRLTAERLSIFGRIRELEKEQCASPRQTASTIANMSRCSPHQAAGELALAEKLASLPGIAKAHRNGDISNGQVAAAADIGTPETEDETIAFVKNATSADLERQAAISRGKLTEERQAAHAHRYLAFKGENNSSTRIHGRLPYAEAKQLEDQLRKIADRLELGDPQRSLPSTRMADALLILTKHNPSASLHEHQKQQAAQASTNEQTAARSSHVSPHNKIGSNQPIPSDPDQSTTFDGGTHQSTTLESSVQANSTDSNPAPTTRMPRQSIFGEGEFDYDEDPFPETQLRTSKPDIDISAYETVGLFDDGIATSTDMFTDELVGIHNAAVTIVQKADTRIIIHWNATTGVVRYENGPPIDHPRLLALLCDAQLEIQHTDNTDQPTGLVTTSYNANFRQDRYLAYRDGPCRVPNCQGKGKTHAHHIFEDQTGRTDRITDVRYMINICNHDHNEHHDSKLEISGDPEGIITFTYPDGRQLHSPARTVPPKIKPKSVQLTSLRKEECA